MSAVRRKCSIIIDFIQLPIQPVDGICSYKFRYWNMIKKILLKLRIYIYIYIYIYVCVFSFKKWTFDMEKQFVVTEYCEIVDDWLIFHL